jgi:hypothetical protein
MATSTVENLAAVELAVHAPLRAEKSTKSSSALSKRNKPKKRPAAPLADVTSKWQGGDVLAGRTKPSRSGGSAKSKQGRANESAGAVAALNLSREDLLKRVSER